MNLEGSLNFQHCHQKILVGMDFLYPSVKSVNELHTLQGSPSGFGCALVPLLNYDQNDIIRKRHNFQVDSNKV